MCCQHQVSTRSTDSPHHSLTQARRCLSLLLLAAGLDSNNPNGIFAGLGLPPLEYGKIVTSIFLQVSVSVFLTLFSCRTQDGFFWTVKPGKPLLAAVNISLIISSFLASFWPKGTLDGLPTGSRF
jgi:H+-transporting ATPase